MVFKELHYSAGSQVAKTECAHVIAGELWLLINFLGRLQLLEELRWPFTGSTFGGIYTKPGNTMHWREYWLSHWELVFAKPVILPPWVFTVMGGKDFFVVFLNKQDTELHQWSTSFHYSSFWVAREETWGRIMPAFSNVVIRIDIPSVRKVSFWWVETYGN